MCATVPLQLAWLALQIAFNKRHVRLPGFATSPQKIHHLASLLDRIQSRPSRRGEEGTGEREGDVTRRAGCWSNGIILVCRSCLGALSRQLNIVGRGLDRSVIIRYHILTRPLKHTTGMFTRTKPWFGAYPPIAIREVVGMGHAILIPRAMSLQIDDRSKSCWLRKSGPRSSAALTSLESRPIEPDRTYNQPLDRADNEPVVGSNKLWASVPKA